jgi:hypothetical protein
VARFVGLPRRLAAGCNSGWLRSSRVAALIKVCVMLPPDENRDTNSHPYTSGRG